MASTIYNSYKTDLFNANINHASATIKCALVTATYTVSTAHDFFNDITNEVSGTGYTAGGATLANKAVSIQSTTAIFDADDVTWSSSTITARAAVLYKDTGTASTSNLLVYVDFGSNLSSSAGNFTIQWNASGIINIA
jgi:hypothetical protein